MEIMWNSSKKAMLSQGSRAMPQHILHRSVKGFGNCCQVKVDRMLVVNTHHRLFYLRVQGNNATDAAGPAALVAACFNISITNRTVRCTDVRQFIDSSPQTWTSACRHACKGTFAPLENVTSTKGTTDPEGSARNSCSSWPLHARWADQRACFG